MSKDDYDKWLDELQFESYRLSFKPNDTDVAMLSSRIHEMKSLPLGTLAECDLAIALQRLETLKQHHASLSQIMAWHIQLTRIHKELAGSFGKNPVQLVGDEAFRSLIDDAVCLLEKIATTFERWKIEQREKQWRHLNSFKHHWPQADVVRWRRTGSLFTTYASKRLFWGTLQLNFALPVKAAIWAGRHIRRLC